MKQDRISRRKFVQLTSVSGAFLVVGCVPVPGGEEIRNLAKGVDVSLNQYVLINENGVITLFNHRPEMGQGTFQSMPMILAEELEVDIDQVEIRQSEADQERYGRQMVVGSHSVNSEFDKLRRMGAAAREMLLKAAANRWGIDRGQVYADQAVVKRVDSKEQLTYGELVLEASKLEVPQELKLKDPSEFKIIGQPVARQDIPLKTNGEAKFGIDIKVDGMLYASIERSNVFLGKALRYNQEEVLQVPGVKHVLKTTRTVFGSEREGVAVLADSFWAAQKGREALQVKWETGNLEKNSSATLMHEFDQAARQSGDVLFARGNADQTLNASAEVVTAAYQTPYQAHVPMEPMNAIVSMTEGSAEFWGSTQNPNGIRSFLAEKYDLPESKVKINYTFMGGGFGRRSLTDVAEEAADLSLQSGAPVKVIWTREDDLTQGPFRACSLNICRGALDGNGNLAGLDHKIVVQEIRNQTGLEMTAGGQIMGGVNTEYAIPNLSVRGVLQKLYVPISYWRSVYHSTNPFAHESFIDEMAAKAEQDPLEFRLAMLTGNERFTRVLEQTRTIWQNARESGVGRGLAICERSGAHFAMVAEVEKDGHGVKLKKITTVLDLGICINPNIVKAQTEGSVVMGLGAALYGLTIEQGAIAQRNFDTYPMLSFAQCPEIETHIVESDAPPDGAGESGLPTVAPALANAIYDLTGRRIRKLPMDLKTIS